MDEEISCSKLEDVDFTKESIVNAIRDVKNNSAPDTDHFPAFLLKECAEELMNPYAYCGDTR